MRTAKGSAVASCGPVAAAPPRAVPVRRIFYRRGRCGRAAKGGRRGRAGARKVRANSFNCNLNHVAPMGGGSPPAPSLGYNADLVLDEFARPLNGLRARSAAPEVAAWHRWRRENTSGMSCGVGVSSPDSSEKKATGRHLANPGESGQRGRCGLQKNAKWVDVGG